MRCRPGTGRKVPHFWPASGHCVKFITVKRAFSLIELLAVIAIVAMLAALSIPAISSVSRATSISSTAQSVLGTLDYAHQTAIAQNRTVEVRFYKLPEEGKPGALPSEYRAMQLFLVDYDNVSALTNPVKFTNPTVIANRLAASSLMDEAFLPEKKAPAGIPVGPISNYVYRSFRFRPDGTADLRLSGNWFLSLVNRNDPIRESDLPANFAKIHIEPLTGKIRLERP